MGSEEAGHICAAATPRRRARTESFPPRVEVELAQRRGRSGEPAAEGAKGSAKNETERSAASRRGMSFSHRAPLEDVEAMVHDRLPFLSLVNRFRTRLSVE